MDARVREDCTQDQGRYQRNVPIWRYVHALDDSLDSHNLAMFGWMIAGRIRHAHTTNEVGAARAKRQFVTTFPVRLRNCRQCSR